jgi:arylformamidase
MNFVFREYDRARLDAEYDNARKIPAETLAAYRVQWAAESERARAAIPCELDLPYGPASGERLDIFRPRGTGLAPVQVYIHGGYWIANDKHDCSYVALAFNAAGFCTVVINYGLIPSVDMAEQVRQCRAALRWVAANITRYGGDASQIYVTGHSAGGHLAVMLLTDPDGPPPGLKGVASLSGLYDLEPVRLCFVNDKLNLSERDVATLSPIRYLPRATAPRLLLTVGGDEGDEFIRQATDFAAAWRSPVPQLACTVIPGINHFSMRAALNDAGSDISRLLWREMGAGRASRED